MGSRLKENPDRTFYWFFEASCPVARDKDPGVLFQFPEDFNDEESRQSLPKFCFPFDIKRVRDGVAVQHFTFVLTDLEGCQRFGFCRLNNSSQTCLCILSYLPWFEVFYKLLNNLADYLTKGQTNEMRELLFALYKQPIPLAVGSVTLQMGGQLLVRNELTHPLGHTEGQEGVPYFIAPDPNTLPSIPENRNLTELVVAVDVGNLLHLYASMLFERRILILASKLSTLTACVHALSAVLYPMYWQHIFIPVLPPHLLDYCCAPMPYLIGVHSSLTEKVRSRGLEDVVILNVDTNTLESPFEDLKRIPSNVVSGLKVRLKQQASSAGWGVSRAFLRAQAQLFGGYRDALQAQEGGLRFSEDLFIEHRSPSMRQFLQSAVHLQFFKQFLDGRLELWSQGKEPDDLFEEEILLYLTGAGSTKSYQQLVGNLKKGSGALMLNVKTKAHTTAKGFTKRGLRSLLTHKDQSEKHPLQRGGSVSETHTQRRFQSDCLQSRLPITQHFGKSRPRRPVHRQGVERQEDDSRESRDMWDSEASRPTIVTHTEPQKVGEDEEEEEGASLLSDPEEMDLLGEIFDTLSSRSSHDRGMLYGTRSLDLFGPECHDYITKRSSATPSQESLSLSVTGSGSLHSWNLEEGLYSPAEDSDWLSQAHEVPDVEEAHRLPDGCSTMESGAGATKGLVTGEELEEWSSNAGY
ncbi:DENN domain-containing protein 1B [Aplochiton taeniatus]